MKPADIAKLRLSAQGITRPPFQRPEEVVRHLLALQAQDYNGALWSIGLRMQRPSLRAVEQAIVDRKLVRTWPMRGTLHVMHADDAAWMVTLLGNRATTAAKSRRLSLGLDEAVMEEVEAVIRTELAGGAIMRRDTLRAALAKKVQRVKIEAPQFSHLLRHLGEQAVICFGPPDGKQPTFVLLEDWLPQAPPKDRDEALGELARRYITSHGPASLRDFAGWGYLTMTDARKGLELARTELETIVVSDTTYYVGRNLRPVDSASVVFLPGFDEYMLGYKDRSAALPTAYSQRIVPGNNGMFLATIVVDGQVVGTWKRHVTGRGVTITPTLFSDKPTLSAAAVQPAITRYRQFVDSPVTLQI